jgi:FkbM family methyltransferase
MNRIKTITIKLLDRILPNRIKNSILHMSFLLAHDEFERFAHKYSFAPHMMFGLADLAKRGFVPATIVDIGAFQGDWSRMAKQIWPASHLVMIEPNTSNQARLVDIAKVLDAHLFCDLLGAKNGPTVTFNVMGSGSSIMSERSAVPRTTEARRLRTLDSLLEEVKPPGLLKIDAQGYELEIMRGASRVLPAFEAVLLEIAVIEINAGAPLLHEVVAFMKSLGFVTYDILEIHRRPLDGALNQVDIIFIREQSDLVADKRHFV